MINKLLLINESFYSAGIDNKQACTKLRDYFKKRSFHLRMPEMKDFFSTAQEAKDVITVTKGKKYI